MLSASCPRTGKFHDVHAPGRCGHMIRFRVHGCLLMKLAQVVYNPSGGSRQSGLAFRMPFASLEFEGFGV